MTQHNRSQVPSRITEAVSQYVRGRDEAIRQMAIALFSGGHVLLEGFPGTGKTLLARTFAQAIGGEFQRVQLVADMLPGDVLGFNVYQPDGQSRFIPGPIFANVILADELNRTTPRTQAAFLEAMQEGRVTIDRTTYPLPQPFLAVATQLPFGFEGTYPLPEGELDRFILRISSGHPDREAETQILQQTDLLENPIVQPVTTPQEVLTIRQLVKQVEVSEPVLGYILDLIGHLRRNPNLVLGPSTRASMALYRASRALAFLEGRDFVTPDDVRSLAAPVLAHRLRLTGEAELDGGTVQQIMEVALESTNVPRGAA